MLKVFFDRSFKKKYLNKFEVYRKNAIFSAGNIDDMFSEAWDVMVFSNPFPDGLNVLADFQNKFPFCTMFVLPSSLISPDIRKEGIFVYSDIMTMMNSLFFIIGNLIEIDKKERILEAFKPEKDPFYQGRIISSILSNSKKTGNCEKKWILVSESGINKSKILEYFFVECEKITFNFRNKKFRQFKDFLNSNIHTELEKYDLIEIDGIPVMKKNQQNEIRDLLDRNTYISEKQIVFSVLNSELKYLENIKDISKIIRIPALRERKSDIQDILVNLICEICKKHSKKPFLPTAKSLEFSENYPWPGNHDQIYRFAENIVLKGEIEALKGLTESVEENTGEKLNIDLNALTREYKKTMEYVWIKKALNMSRKNRKEAAYILGLSYKSFSHKMNEYKDYLLSEE